MFSLMALHNVYSPTNIAIFKSCLRGNDSGILYWTAMGLLEERGSKEKDS